MEHPWQRAVSSGRWQAHGKHELKQERTQEQKQGQQYDPVRRTATRIGRNTDENWSWYSNWDSYIHERFFFMFMNWFAHQVSIVRSAEPAIANIIQISEISKLCTLVDEDLSFHSIHGCLVLHPIAALDDATRSGGCFRGISWM